MATTSVTTLLNKAMREAQRIAEADGYTTLNATIAFEAAEKVVIQTIPANYGDLLSIFASLNLSLGDLVKKYGRDATIDDLLIPVLVQFLTVQILRSADPEPPDSVIYPSRRIPRRF